MGESISFRSVPSLYEAIMGSLQHFKMDHLEPRISFEVVKDVTIRSENDLNVLDMAYLKIRMWDFCVFTAGGKEGVIPFEPGDYMVEVEDVGQIVDGQFPIRFRQLRVCLDDSPDRWAAIMNTCV